MKKNLLYALAASLLFAAPAAAQFTVTAPTGVTNVKAADDFATTAFQDPWDMSQRTDVGWWLFGSDFPPSNWTNPTFSGGIFTGTTAGSGARLFMLESGLLPTATPPGATPIGKTGQQFPINANKYTHLLYKMSSPTGFQDTGNPNNLSQYIWSTNTIYEGQTLAASKEVIKGNAIYDVDLRTLALGGSSWNGTKRSFQFLPNQVAGAAISIDWVRLVDGSDLTLFKTISWTGAGNADVYLDNDNIGSNGNLGRIAINVAAKSISFFVGGLPAGTYFAAVRTHVPTAADVTNGSGFAYSTGSWVVNGIPTLTFTTPSEEGSSEDFATTKFGDAWDFTSMNDIDSTLPGFPGKVFVNSDGIGTLNLRNEAGVDLGPQTVYFGTSAPASAESGNVGDPQIYTLFWDGKGKVAQIDPRRYRILTIDAGIPNLARSLPGGSIGRVVWRAFNEPVTDSQGVKARAVGEHWAFNSAAGENTMARISIDMNKMPVEPGSLNTNTTWSSGIAAGGLDAFRFDPHEFSAPTQFFIKRIKLAALERSIGGVLTIRWTYSEPSGTVQFFREASTAPKNFAGISISPVMSATLGSFAWNASVPDNEYQIYAVFSDGTNTNQVYAPTNVVVDSTNVAVKQINLNRTSLNFSILGPIRTQAQTIRLTFSGSGSECWTTSSNAGSLISVTPATGNGATAISIEPAAAANFPGGTTNALITVQSCTNPSNSRAIAVAVTAFNSTTAPAGAMDTPAAGAVVTGSVAVTGWAADDLEVTNVRICRDPIPSTETTTPFACGGQGRVFIGDAVFIDDARSDIEQANPTKPFNYRAGWGYLMLTNFLPNQGNGVVTLYAYATDREGNTSLLGSKSISTQNASATKPFGAIDTPGQGEVICGTSYVNFGWALTQPPKDIPANSSTITVFIDGVPVGSPGPRAARSDITALFPTYNTTHSTGGFVFNTTLYANGVHSIFWVVRDNAGLQDGIGSRFFTISNPCSGS